MKTFLKIVLGLAVIIALGMGSVFFFTRGLIEVADNFFVALTQDEVEQAYALTAVGFQSTVSQQEMLSYLSEYKLTEVNSTNWSNRSISGDQGELQGTVDTVSGGPVPVSLSFVKDGEEWRILRINATGPAMGESSPASPAAPTERELLVLVQDVTNAFARSVSQKSMDTLYAHISELWRSQTTPEELGSIFESFYKFGDNILILETAPPQFDAPATLGDDGILEISGRYVTGPDTTTFTHRYIYEGLGWKVIGLSLQVVPTPQAAADEEPAT